MQYSLEAKAYEIITKRREVLIKKTPKENRNEVSTLESTSKDALDAKEPYEREKRQQSVVIKGMQEEESENALSLSRNITKPSKDCFAVHGIIAYGAHRGGWKRLDEVSC